MIEIQSKTNEHFRRWCDLSSARGIKKNGEFILMGEKLILEFLENAANFKIKAEIICEGLSPLRHEKLRGAASNVRVYKLSKTLFNEVDVVGTHFNLLVLEVPEITVLGAGAAQGLEIVAPLGDPANLGALARSALAFNAQKMILTEESCNPFHPKAIKASAGALLQLPLVRVALKFADFIAQNEDIYALDMIGEGVDRFPWPRDIRLAIGEEGPGFGALQGLKKLRVPTQGVESLNATVAASIALYSYQVWNAKKPG